MVNHPQFIDRQHKNLIYANIAENLETTSEEVQKKIRGLHSYYCQVKRESKGKSGDAAKKKIKWAFFESFKFIDRNPVCTMVDSANADFCVVQPEQFRRNPAKQRRSEDTSQHVINPLMEHVVRAFEKDTSGAEDRQQTTEDQLFGEMVAMKLADGDDKEDAKLDILTQLSQLQSRQKRQNIEM